VRSSNSIAWNHQRLDARSTIGSMVTPTKANEDEETDKTRQRVGGRPSQISREQIVAAARCIPQGELTMQAVADALGVSRKALHYYVGNRQGLINLVVADLFESALATVDLPRDADWQTVLQVWAHAIRDGVVQVGVGATYVQLRGMGGAAAMELSERVIESLVGAGFSHLLARRALTVVANVAFTHANIALLEEQHGIYPHEYELATALDQAPDDKFPGLRHVLACAQSEDPSHSFEFELDLAVTGLERALATQSG
jgi:TetR/AcrR family transcriptional regulator, tetracycline repressor protein